MRRHVHRMVLVLVVAGMLQLACNVGASPGAEQTAVASTLTAIASQAPPRAAPDTPLPASGTLPPPSETVTATPSLTLTPTGTSTLTLTPQPCDAAAFVKDVTYPDGAEVFGGLRSPRPGV